MKNSTLYILFTLLFSLTIQAQDACGSAIWQKKDVHGHSFAHAHTQTRFALRIERNNEK